MRSKEDTDNSRRVFQSASTSGRYKYDMMPRCPDCGIHMKYIYGEMFECPVCHRQEQTQFGKVRSYLEEHGPQPAMVISNETGVPVNVIDNFLRQGRIEIPDGSPVYIKCQSCGADIRYGRYCPDCMVRTTKELGKAMLMSEVGEKPTNKPDMSGKMHILNSSLRTRDGK